MQTHNHQPLDIASIRSKLSESKANGTQETWTNKATYFPTPPSKAITERVESYKKDAAHSFENSKPIFLHLHLHWHKYLAAAVFILFHTIGVRPQWFPGMENMDSLYGQSFAIAAFFLSLPALMVFFLLRQLRRSLQTAAQITEFKTWTNIEKIGAIIGFAIAFYMTFYVSSPLDEYLITPPDKFDLSAREWILSGVKCVGGAVIGSMLARKAITF